MKLHGKLLGTGGGRSGTVEYGAMCRSQRSYVNFLVKKGDHELVRGGCGEAGVEIVYGGGEEGGDGGEGWQGCETRGERPLFLSKIENAVISGPDAVVWGNCKVYVDSHGCYTPLFRQVRGSEERSDELAA